MLGKAVEEVLNTIIAYMDAWRFDFTRTQIDCL